MNAVLAPGRCHGEAAIDKVPHRWPDLVVRRSALGLREEELADVLNVDLSKYYGRESGAITVGPHLVEELQLMEAFVATSAAQMVADAPARGVVVLDVAINQEVFTSAYPSACTRRDGAAYPLTLQLVAAGRAAGALGRQSREVEVHRGERRADLVARRLAVGLIDRHIAVRLFGVNKKSYAEAEAGKKYPGGSLIAEYQALDDFIVQAADQLDVITDPQSTAVVTMSDQRQFELRYPQARARRTGVPYPVCVHHVAAARRAQELAAAGQEVRIIVP